MKQPKAQNRDISSSAFLFWSTTLLGGGGDQDVDGEGLLMTLAVVDAGAGGVLLGMVVAIREYCWEWWWQLTAHSYRLPNPT